MSKDNFRALVSANNSGKQIPAVNLVRDTPIIAATLSKLVQPTDRKEFDQSGNRKVTAPNHSNIIGISKDIAQKKKDNTNVMDLFPELRLAGDILISLINSPKDMYSSELSISVPSDLLVSPITNLVLPIIEDYLKEDYGINEEIPVMLEKVLLINGAYPVVVIPENSVDDLINGKVDISLESLKTHMDDKGIFKSAGWLGASTVTQANPTIKNFGLESFLGDAGPRSGMIDPVVKFMDKDKKAVALEDTIVIDNFSALKLPKIIETRRKNSSRRLLDGNLTSNKVFSIGNESNNTITDKQLTSLLYKNKPHTTVNLRRVKTSNQLDRDTVGAPLIIKLPTESVIPIYQPGNYSEHVGYFVVLDSEGNPVSIDSDFSAYDDMRFKHSMSTNMNSSIVQRTADQFQVNCDAVTFDNVSRVYSDIIEADLLSRLKNGVIGENVSIARPEEIFRIMTARMLSKQRTQILFVPKELLTYFAIDFRENGTGKSLIEGMMVLNALRAATMFANVNRGIVNSIGRTEVEINVDEHDPQPRKTLEIAMHEVLKTKQSQTLPATISPVDIMTYINTSGIQFKFGQIPGLPSTNLNFSEVSTSYERPDSDLEDSLRERQIMGIGIPVEMVDNAKGVDFATTATNNNILLNKRIIQYQIKFEPLITDNARTIILNHGGIMGKIKEAIKNNISKLTEVQKTNELFEEYKNNEDLLVHLLSLEVVSNFEIKLPRPDVIAIDTITEAYTKHEEMVEKGIDAWFSSDILAAAYIGEASSERVDEVRAMIKAQMMRTWMTSNNMLPEMADMLTVDDEGKYVYNNVETQRQHVFAATKFIRDLLEKTVPTAQAADRDINKITGGEDLGEGSVDGGSDYSSDDSGSDDTSNTSEEDTGGGDDDLDAGLDMPDFGDI